MESVPYQCLNADRFCDWASAQVYMNRTRKHQHECSAAGVLIKQVASHMPWKHLAAQIHQRQQQAYGFERNKFKHSILCCKNWRCNYEATSLCIHKTDAEPGILACFGSSSSTSAALAASKSAWTSSPAKARLMSYA